MGNGIKNESVSRTVELYVRVAAARRPRAASRCTGVTKLITVRGRFNVFLEGCCDLYPWADGLMFNGVKVPWGWSMCLMPEDKRKARVTECCSMCYQYKQCTYDAFEVRAGAA